MARCLMIEWMLQDLETQTAEVHQLAEVHLLAEAHQLMAFRAFLAGRSMNNSES
jgi:hypothetical protein